MSVFPTKIIRSLKIKSEVKLASVYFKDADREQSAIPI
jgi:hypothetical protein